MAKKALPPGFYWRKNTIWLRRDPVTGKAVSTRYGDVVAAIEFRAQRERIAANPTLKAADEATVGAWAKRTMIAKQKSGRADGTLNMYGIKLGHIARVFGADRKLHTIDAQLVDAYIARRQEEGAKNNTIQRELTCLWQMLKLAKRARVYPYELSEVKPYDFSANYIPVTRVLAPEDLPKLLAVLTEAERAWVCFAIATGADVSDVERAQPGDYDPSRGVIRMRGTKNKYRKGEIPVPRQFAELLLAALPHLPLSWPNVSKRLPEKCVKAGVPYMSPKDLRRTAATWLQESGVRIDTLAKFMRHGGVKMAHDVYGQGRAEKLREQIDKQTGGQIRYTPHGPLAESVDAGDLKNHSAAQDSGKNKQKQASGRSIKQQRSVTIGTDPLHRVAESRARRSAALASIDPTLKPAQLVHESLVEAYYLAEGDPDAADRLRDRLTAAADLMGGDK